MVDCSEVLKFELSVPGTEPFEEHNFIIRRKGCSRISMIL